MKIFIHGDWHEGKQGSTPVSNPFDGSIIDDVPKADLGQLDEAIRGAVLGAAQMRRSTPLERSAWLRRASEIIRERQDELGRLISMEEGKVLKEGIFEAGRAANTLELCAEEAKRISGEMLPLGAVPGAHQHLGFTLRVPCGVVAAITPFNFPMNLVAHKIGPALAAGNSVILKPAEDTPLSALTLTEILLEAGIPPLAIACITGSGIELGPVLCRDERVRKISFTGSVKVGKAISSVAGIKKLTMELGSNSPLIIMDDADIEQVVEATIRSGYSNAGQVCISAQRVIVDRAIHGDFLDALIPKVRALTLGDQLAEGTRVGPMVRESDAERVHSWIAEAQAAGAELLCGGERNGTLLAPAVLDRVSQDMRVSREELFGPAVCVSQAESLDAAIAMANDSQFGLSAAIYTKNLDRALRFASEIESGNIHINGGPAWRADLMPYGGLKESGTGKEGPRYAIEEMTEIKSVIIHPSNRS